MKKIILGLILLSTQVFAQIEFNEKRIDFVEHINLYGISCKIVVGQDLPKEDRTFTILEKLGLHHRNSNILFDNEVASTSGCDLAILDKLIKDSHMSFGHAEATITIVKRTAKFPRIVFGKCQRNYQEKLIIDFEQGTVLETSLLGKLLPAVGCN